MKVSDLNPYRLERRPGEQGPRPLLDNQDRVEKLVTGKVSTTKKPKPNNIITSTNGMKLRKDILTIGTWNVRTLWETGKLSLLMNELKRFRYDIIGVSETRWTGKGETATGDFIWSGEEKIHANGVGFLLSRKAKNALIGYNPVSSRVITARFNGTPFKITAIHVYAPTSTSSDEEIEAFYNCIENTLAKVPKKDLILMSGDWNAKVGNDNTGWNSVMGRYSFGDRNDRGERLLEFATTHRLFICNTRFQHKADRKWTWESPDGVHKNMIDLILVQQRWKSSVINCRTFQSADIGSDHSLILCNIKLHLKKIYHKRNQNCKLNVKQLNNITTKRLYTDLLKEKIEKFQPDSSVEEHSNEILNAIRETGKAAISTIKPSRKPWISSETLQLVEKKRLAKLTKNISIENRNKYKEACNLVKRSVKQDKEQWLQEQYIEIDKGLRVGNTRTAYSLIRTLKKTDFAPRLNLLRSHEGNLLQSKEAIKKRWTQYCSNLYKDNSGGDIVIKELEEISPPIQQESHDILFSEVEQAIQSLKKNKSPDSDGIPAELLQSGGESLTHQIHQLCNKIWHSEMIPEDWGKSLLIPLPKRGDLSECSNYRTISLINHISKVLLMILLNRLQYQLNPYLSEEQSGFRKDRSTVHQILILRLIAEKAKRKGKKIYNGFIDFQKAFDTVNHKVLWAVLKSYGVDYKLITLLKKIYGKAQSAIRINKENGEWFHPNVGTRQGDPLSPLLFITYLERIMEKVKQNPCRVNINGNLINNLRFADEIDLIDENFNNLIKQIEITSDSTKQARLIINAKKTKIMVFGEKDNNQEIKISRETIQNVNKFEYLGSLLTWDNNCTEEIKRRISKTTGALASIKHIISNGKIKVESKIKILTTTVFSVLLYASETWTLKERDKKKLLAFEMRCYRQVLKIK